MKLKLYTAIAFSFCASLFAATPSFHSFDTNDFTVTPSLTNPLTIHSKGSGGTNVFNTIIVTNLYVTTNTYVTINGDTNAVGLWINDNGNYIPSVEQNQLTATNIIGNERLQAAGSFILKALMGYTLGAGLNDVSALTNSVLWITGFDSDPANSSLRLDSGNGQGQLMVIQNFADNSGFTMRNGEALFNSAPNSYQILNGDWVSSHKGDCLLLYNNGQSWAEIGRISGTTNNTGSSLWESVAGVLRPLGHSLGTNQFTIAESTGWTGTGTNAFLDDGTFGGIALMNPTDGYLPYKFNDYSFEDSPLYRVDASTVAVMHDSTNSIELIGGNVGEIWFHSPVGSPSVIKSDTELYYDLEGNGSRFRMGNLLFTPLTTSQASLGAAATPWQWTYTDSVGWGGHTASFDSAGGANPEGVVTADPGSIWRNTSAGSVWRKSTGVGNTGWIEFSSTAINPTDTYIPFRTNSTTFLNSPFYVVSTNASIDSQLVFGPGATNVMYRSGNNIVITNNAAAGTAGLEVATSDGSLALLSAGGNTAYLRGASGSALYDSLTSGNELLWTNNRLWPISANAILGGSEVTSPSTPFGLLNVKTNRVYGFISGTDYSRLSIYHGGTNGSVVFDSQSSGIAGNPRPITLNFGGTNYYEFASTGITLGPGTTNVLYRNGSHLFYTNGDANVDIKINNGSGKTAAFGLNAGGQAELRAEGTANAVSLSNGTDILTLFSNGFYPATYPISLGSSANPWGPNFYMAGFVSGTNYSRLYISHSGTNSPIVYDSQSTGTAGSPKNHRFDLGSTNQFAIGDGWIQLMRGMTKAEKATITATNGMVVYQTDNTPGLRAYVNGSWVMISTVADP